MTTEEQNYRKQLGELLPQLQKTGKSLEDAAKLYADVPDLLEDIVEKVGGLASDKRLAAGAAGAGLILDEKEKADAKDFMNLPEDIKAYEALEAEIAKLTAQFNSSDYNVRLSVGPQIQELKTQLNGLKSEIEGKLDAISLTIDNYNADEAKKAAFNEFMPPQAQNQPATTPPTNEQPAQGDKPEAQFIIDEMVAQIGNNMASLMNQMFTGVDESYFTKIKETLNKIDTQVDENKDLIKAISAGESGDGGTSPKPNTPAATQSAPLLGGEAFAPTIGQAHDGIDSVPREGTWLLDKGERVIDARTNQDLKSFLAKNDDKEEILDLIFKNNTISQQTYDLLVQRLADERAQPATLINPSTGQAMPAEFTELAAQGSTQQLQDFKTAAVNAEQAITSFLGSMEGMNENLQGLEDILKDTLNTESIFKAIYEGDGLDSLLSNLHEQLNAYAAQKASHLLMESAYETVLGTAALLNPFSTANSAGHFAAAAEYAAGATLMASFAKLTGMAHDGMDNIPQEGSWLLEKGERVVDSRTNQDLKSFLAKGRGNITNNINIYGGDAEGIQKILPELEKAVVQAVAGNIIMGGEIKQAIMRYTR